MQAAHSKSVWEQQQHRAVQKGVQGEKAYSQGPRTLELMGRSQARLVQKECRFLHPGDVVEAATGLSSGCRERSPWPSLLLLPGVSQLAAFL